MKKVVNKRLHLFILLSILSLFTNGQVPGTKKWDFTTGSGIKSSPAIGNDGTVYFGSKDKSVYALHADGTKRWDFSTGGEIYASPAIGPDGTVYISSTDYKLYAFTADGTKKWEYQAGSALYKTAAVSAAGIVYFGSQDNYLYAINPDGTLKWKYSGGDMFTSDPVIGASGEIYICCWDVLFAIDANGSKKWEFPIDNIMNEAPAIGKDGTLYLGTNDSKMYAINPNGTKKWEFATGGDVYSSPCIGSDSTIYFTSSDYKLYALNPDGTKKWEFLTDNTIYSSPAIGMDGVVYFGSDDDKLYAINPDGTKKWEFQTGGNVPSSPSIAADGTIYVGSENGKLYAVNSSSNGLEDSPWPKYHHDNFNSGLCSQTTYSIGIGSNDFSCMAQPNQEKSFTLQFSNFYNSDMEIKKAQFDNFNFVTASNLPVTLGPGTTKELTFKIKSPSNQWYTPALTLDYTFKGANSTQSWGLNGFVFLDDNSELAHTANQVMHVWTTLDPGNAIISNNTKGVFFRLLHEYPSARKCFAEALSNSLDAGYGFDGIMMNQGVIRSDQSLSDSADYYYTSAMDDLTTADTASVLVPQIYYNQAWESCTASNYGEATSLALKVIHHNKANSYLKAKAYALLGVVKFNQDSTANAVINFNNAIDLDPEGPIGNLSRSNLAAITNTGTSEADPSDLIKLFPNPGDGRMVLYAENWEGMMDLKVFNSTGKEVYAKKFQNAVYAYHELDFSSFPKGVYWLRINTGTRTYSSKVVIVK
jgi:outer membrane protein assembly factor BamB/tetratricopeptide (TPR) repeat protein